MPESQGGKTKFFPADKGHFAEGGDAWVVLNAGMEIVQDESGWIIDVWDPETNKAYKGAADAAFDVDSIDRDHTFVMPDAIKEPEDMTDAELTEALGRKKIDFSAEKRSIRVQQLALVAKRKRMDALFAEQVQRALREKTGSGYLPRIPRYSMSLTGYGFKVASVRSYQRYYGATRYRYR